MCTSGNTAALYLLTRWNNQRFEFIFTSLLDTTPQLLQCIQAVHSSYEASRLFRELKLRGMLQTDSTNACHYVWGHGDSNCNQSAATLGSLTLSNFRVSSGIQYLQVELADSPVVHG